MIGLALLLVAAYLFIGTMTNARAYREGVAISPLVLSIALFIVGLLVLIGLYTLQPNEAAIVQLFGDYRGTTRVPGLRAIMHGAVSMVQMALHELSERQVVDLDDERKAAMVSNLLTVLCAESEVQPVINTGTLYT